MLLQNAERFDEIVTNCSSLSACSELHKPRQSGPFRNWGEKKSGVLILWRQTLRLIAEFGKFSPSFQATFKQASNHGWLFFFLLSSEKQPNAQLQMVKSTSPWWNICCSAESVVHHYAPMEALQTPEKYFNFLSALKALTWKSALSLS